MTQRTLVQRITAKALTFRPVRAFLLYQEANGSALADSITYRTLFSVFAGVLLGFSLAALWLAGNPDAMNSLIVAVNNAVPGLIGEKGLISPDSIQAPAGLSIAGAISFVGLIGAATGAISSLRFAMRTIAGTLGDELFFVWQILRNLGLALGIGLLLAASAGMTFAGTAGIGLLADVLHVPDKSLLVTVGARVVTILAVFILDTLIIVALYRVLSGLRAPSGALWGGAIVGAIGLVILQQLSGLFVRGASSNPLLASFASLIALLLWLNLSAQVILIATAYIVTGTAEAHDRVRNVHGAQTMAQLKVRRAEAAVAVASATLHAARDAESKERGADASGEGQQTR